MPIWKKNTRKTKIASANALSRAGRLLPRLAACLAAACLAAGTLSGCGPLSLLSPAANTEAAPAANPETGGQSSPGPASAGDGAAGDKSANPSPAANTATDPSPTEKEAAADGAASPSPAKDAAAGPAAAEDGAAAILVLPYDDPDPGQMAAAYPWIDSDLLDNAGKLEGLAETDDFHAAVNRDWLTSNQIPSGYVAYDSFSERQREVDAELLDILESKVVFSDDHIAHSQKLVRDYYRMWLDWDARNAAGIEPLRQVVAPLVAVQSLQEMTAYLSDPRTTIEALPLASSFTAANLNDADSTAVYIDPPALVFQDPMYYEYLDADSWKTQPRYMYAAGYMLERLGYTEADRDRILQDSYAFECEMAAHMRTTEQANAEDAALLSNNPRTLAQLEEAQGAFPLTGMLEGAGLSGSDIFILEQPEWLDCMRNLYDEAHLEKMKSYLLVSDVLQFMELLDRDCYDRMGQVRNILSGSSGQLDDRKAACDATNSVLQMELGEVYAETYITDKTRADVTAIIQDIVNYYRNMIAGEDFLSEATKAEALKKLDTLTVRVASPQPEGNAPIGDLAPAPPSGDPGTAEGQNSSSAAGNAAKAQDAGQDAPDGSPSGKTDRILDFRGPEEGGSLIEARIAISEDTCLTMAERVNQPVDRSKWIAAPQEVNAYYYPLDNSINIPAGILGGMFYSDAMPIEEKLGHVGIVAAHEISHAFDTSGRQYDEHGNLRNWWTEEDYRLFHARAQKLVDYYCGFTPIDGYSVKGGMLDTEAIADLTGVKCTLRLAASMENFDYDRFFRSLASNWRCLTTLETEAYSIEQDTHPLAYLRTNAVVVQFEEFHRTYGTKEGDGMYLAPSYRLEIW